MRRVRRIRGRRRRGRARRRGRGRQLRRVRVVLCFFLRGGVGQGWYHGLCGGTGPGVVAYLSLVSPHGHSTFLPTLIPPLRANTAITGGSVSSSSCPVDHFNPPSRHHSHRFPPGPNVAMLSGPEHVPGQPAIPGGRVSSSFPRVTISIPLPAIIPIASPQAPTSPCCLVRSTSQGSPPSLAAACHLGGSRRRSWSAGHGSCRQEGEGEVRGREGVALGRWKGARAVVYTGGLGRAGRGGERGKVVV